MASEPDFDTPLATGPRPLSMGPQVRELQQELAMHDAKAGGEGSSGGGRYGAYSAEQRGSLRPRVADFLQAPSSSGYDSPDPLDLGTLRQAREILYMARVSSMAVHSLQSGSKDRRRTGMRAAPDDSRPGVESEAGFGAAGVARLAAMGGTEASRGISPQGPAPDRTAAFEGFKAGPAAAKTALLAENRARLRERKARAKELSLAINATKKELDTVKATADKLKATRLAAGGEDAQVLTSSELDALSQLKALKSSYREAFNELSSVKSEADYTAQLVEACQAEVVHDFDVWYKARYGDSPAQTKCNEDSSDFPTSPLGGSGRLPPPLHADPRHASPSPLRVTVPPASQNHSNSASSSPTYPTNSNLNSSTVHPASKPPRKHTASLLAPDEAGDAAAIAYYRAQSVLLQKGGPDVAHRPGSVKKHRAPTMFGSTNRPALDAQSHDLDGVMHPHRKPGS
ncbi:MAG: hypothetical protein WDW38_003535 [Sanguina aurantia]